MVLYNLAKLYDTMYVFEDHFLRKDRAKERFKWVEKKDIPDEFFPFFYPHNGRFLMEEIVFEHMDLILSVGKPSIILDRVLDHMVMTKRLIQFYLNGVDLEFVEYNHYSLCRATKLIAHSDLPDKIKCMLISFLADPAYITQKLVNGMFYIESQISKQYEGKNDLLTDVLLDLNSSELRNIAARFSPIIRKKDVPIYHSIGLLDATGIKVWNYPDYQVVYLGINYKEAIRGIDKTSLESFGKIVADPERLFLLNMIWEKGPLTMDDICSNALMSGWKTYRQLDVLQQTGMITIENRDHALYYSVNRKYFDETLIFLKKYSDIFR